MGTTAENQPELKEQEEYFQVKKDLEKYFSKEQRREIYSFFGRGFCLQGKIAIAKIFVTAASQGKFFKDIILCCEQEYHRSWKLQPVFIRGNSDTSLVIGLQNLLALENIRRKLGIPLS